MPTGVRLPNARNHLFDAAERVLRREGPAGLTSRAVTAEAAVSKGVLHRHFADFDAFLADLVRDRMVRVYGQATTLKQAAGTGTVAGNLARALIDLMDPVTVAIIALVVFRDEVRVRLRQAGRHGVPVLAEATAMIAGYLDDECAMGRIAADADVDSLALALVGTGHLLFADQEGDLPDEDALSAVVETIIADVVQRRLL